MTSLERAIIVATRAHEGQRDRAGDRFILHPLRVMMAVQPADRVLAVLHDMVEDTNLTFEALAADGFRHEINALDYLTRRAHEDYPVYIRRVRSHAAARRVKIADLKDNLDPERMARLPTKVRARLEPRYREALVTLGGMHV